MATKTFAALIVVLAVFGPGLAPVVQGQNFECAFTQEKYSSGKPNKASCSMLPEKVYSTKWHTPEKGEHCDVKTVYSYEDLTDFKVDTRGNTVSWTEQFGLTDEAKPKQKAYYVSEGMNEKEAEKKVNFVRSLKYSLPIITHHTSKMTIFYDEVMQKRLEPPREVPEHTFILSDKNSLFYLYIPEVSGHAILLEPRGMADSSWVTMHFGRCRKLQ